MTPCSPAAQTGREQVEQRKPVRGGLRMQVCLHWQNLSGCYEKLGLTKQINKGGVATCFTAETNKGWLMTQPAMKEFCLQRTPARHACPRAAFPMPGKLASCRILAETSRTRGSGLAAAHSQAQGAASCEAENPSQEAAVR